MIAEEYELTTVWSGSDVGVYLGALKGVEPFLVRDMVTDAVPKTVCPPRLIGALIVKLLQDRGAMTQSQLASACNRATGETRKALRRLAKRGRVELEQPCLLAIEPHDGQRWRVRVGRNSSVEYLSTSAVTLKTLRLSRTPLTRAGLTEACGRPYTEVSRAIDIHVKHGRIVAVDAPPEATGGRPARAYRVVLGGVSTTPQAIRARRYRDKKRKGPHDRETEAA